MPDTGSPYNLPFPLASQVPDVPRDLELLARQTHAKLATVAQDAAAIGVRATALEKLTAAPTVDGLVLHKIVTGWQITFQRCWRWGYLVFSVVDVRPTAAKPASTSGDPINYQMTAWNTAVKPTVDMWPASGFYASGPAMGSFQTTGLYLNHMEAGWIWPANHVKRFGGWFFTAAQPR